MPRPKRFQVLSEPWMCLRTHRRIPGSSMPMWVMTPAACAVQTRGEAPRCSSLTVMVPVGMRKISDPITHMMTPPVA